MDRLRSRIRSETGVGSAPWTRSQLRALHRVVYGAPSSTSELAAAEFIRPQSMAQTITSLEKEGLVERHADPSDGRRSLIVATERGRQETEIWAHSREEWLASVIENNIPEADRTRLANLVDVLVRLADS